MRLPVALLHSTLAVYDLFSPYRREPESQCIFSLVWRPDFLFQTPTLRRRVLIDASMGSCSSTRSCSSLRPCPFHLCHLFIGDKATSDVESHVRQNISSIALGNHRSGRDPISRVLGLIPYEPALSPFPPPGIDAHVRRSSVFSPPPLKFPSVTDARSQATQWLSEHPLPRMKLLILGKNITGYR